MSSSYDQAKASWLEDNDRNWPHDPAQTEAGIDVKLLYTAEDVKTIDYLEEVGFPGAPPFTRGPYNTMYRGRLWTMRQYAGFGTAEQTNQRFKYLLKQGVTGLSVAFDLPSQIGYDSDDSFVEDEVGRVGVAIDTLADMERTFQDIPLDQVSVNFTINSTAIIMLAMLVVLAQKRGIPLEKISGTTQNDMIKEFQSHQHLRLSYPRAGSITHPGTGTDHGGRHHLLGAGHAAQH
jgi:methylmalonyl-CoA mutase N-terminal domain/subunit